MQNAKCTTQNAKCRIQNSKFNFEFQIMLQFKIEIVATAIVLL